MFFIGGVVSISYRVELFCVPFFLYFLLLCCVCFLSIFWLGSLCQYMVKRERNSWYVGILFVLFRGSWNCFWYGEILCFLFHIAYWFIFMRLFMIYVFILCYVKSRSHLCFTCIFHTCVYALVECFRKYTSWFSRAAIYTCNW